MRVSQPQGRPLTLGEAARSPCTPSSRSHRSPQNEASRGKRERRPLCRGDLIAPLTPAPWGPLQTLASPSWISPDTWDPSRLFPVPRSSPDPSAPGEHPYEDPCFFLSSQTPRLGSYPPDRTQKTSNYSPLQLTLPRSALALAPFVLPLGDRMPRGRSSPRLSRTPGVPSHPWRLCPVNLTLQIRDSMQSRMCLTVNISEPSRGVPFNRFSD